MNGTSSAEADARQAEIVALRQAVLQAQLRLAELTGEAAEASSPGAHAGLAAAAARRDEAAKRQLVEESLRESEARLYAVTANLTEGLIVRDLDGNLIHWNRAALEMLGFASMEEAQRYYPELDDIFELSSMEGEVIPVDEWPLRRVLDGETLRKVPFRIRRRASNWRRVFSFSGSIVSVSNGKPVAFVTMEDVTSRLQAEDTLRENARLAALDAEVRSVLMRAETLEQMFQWCCEALVAFLDGAFARIWTVDEAGKMLELQASAGLYTHLDGPHSRVPVGQFKIGAVAKERKPHLTNRVVGDPRVSDQEWAKREGMVAFAGYPLLLKDELLGVVAMFARHPLSLAALTALSYVADTISVGIERKRAEVRLRRSEEWLKLVTNLVPVMIFAKDGAGRFVFANRVLAEAAGRSVEEIIGKSDLDLTGDPALAEAYRRTDRRVIEAGEEIFIEDEPSADRRGVITSLQTIKVPFTLPETNEVGVLGVSMDITERKRTEARLRRLVESNAQGVIFWNTKGDILGGNDAFLSISGYTREELDSGRINWLAMTPPEYAALDQHAMEELAAKGVCSSYEKEWIRKDGSRVPILQGAAMFEDNRDEGVCFVLDLSERKKLEQQFLRVQRMESIGTLAGGIAHDLNNALGPILLALDILHMRFPDAASSDLLDTIRSSADRGAAMVRQLLSFARGVEGLRVKLPVAPLLREVEKIARDTFLKKIEVQVRVPGDLWMVSGDSTQLHQLLLNLCLNARDAMSDGGTLTISGENVVIDEQFAALSRDASSGTYVCLEVRDTGTGMSPAVMDQIFDPFFTTKELGKGTGLGLSTSLAIVKSHGGFIRVESKLTVGTTFKIYLPALKETAESVGEELPLEIPRGRGELILVVDDEESTRRVTKQTLEAFGYRVILAPDGSEAIILFAPLLAEIALVITDMMMPVLDGPATIRVLQKLQPEVRIIGVSGLIADVRVEQAKSLGVKHFLPKPYAGSALLQLIQQVLQEPAAGE